MESADIVGSWEIVDWVQDYDDGRTVYPMGARPRGVLVYTSDGRMLSMVSASDRPPFATGGQWDADDAEKVAAYQSFLAYCGTFSVCGDQVRHQVDLSLFPNWVGAELVRTARWRDGELELLARLEDGTPEARTARLRWRRAVA
ncbi:lipocalin-like domain-containing protein [Saccharomonospora sp. NPDC046836]|uniref:lipocalin-like domain-containing protein n=1 Tax=Saccharomonospora sp. NPDC046836 TaxID=3156921 RepID=UPI0033FED5F0